MGLIVEPLSSGKCSGSCLSSSGSRVGHEDNVKDAEGTDAEQDVSPFISPTMTKPPILSFCRQPVGALPMVLESTEILRVDLGIGAGS